MLNSITTSILTRALLCFLALSFATSHAQSTRYALLNINNLTSWLRNNGISNRSPQNNFGSRFPRGTANVVYQDGFVWGGKAYVDAARTQPAPFNQLIRVGGATYRSASRAGRIIGFGANAVAADSNAAAARVYRIRRDYAEMSEAELRRDAAEVFEIALEEVTMEQMQTVAAQYERDWNEWPVAFGAPFIDRNRNGVYDPPPAFNHITTKDLIVGNYDEPGIASLQLDEPADQVLWTVYNDLDPNLRNVRWGSEPLGLEVQITEWAYKSALTYGGYFYRRVRVLNKGGVAINANGEKGAFWIDNMYLCQWTDVDLGFAGDDLTGCDTTLSLGYVYNGQSNDEVFTGFGLRPPSLGYSFVQGPRVPASGRKAFFDMKEISGWKNLPMTSFIYQRTGDPFSEPGATFAYEFGTLVWYKLLRGFAPVQGAEVYFPFPPGMKPGPFPLSGDPITRTGFIDGYFGGPVDLGPGDRRFHMNAGPFTLAPGDTQEAVIACVAGMGADRLSSVSVMKFLTKHVREAYPSRASLIEPNPAAPQEPEPPSYYSLSPNYPNPFTRATSFVYTLKREAEVRVSIFDVMGREVAVPEQQHKREGTYRVSWDGRDQSNRALPSGVYFFRLKAGHINITQKAVLVR